ncbi:hypothetical protein FRB96_004058 [Tulasnella sp. 330]|nr:hypothetical protein FRB96_004058 [Tulasnella sp. 330]
MFVSQSACDNYAPTIFPSHPSSYPNIKSGVPAELSRRELNQLSRQAASQIRRAIQHAQTAEALTAHDAIIQASRLRGLATCDADAPAQGRLVTTTLIHALLRAGRRFKAAQIAETAWLGSVAKSSPSILDGQANISPTKAMRLSYKTSEAIIMSLCPPPPYLADLQQNPPWRLFAEQIDPAARQVERKARNVLTSVELQAESSMPFVGERVLPNHRAHEAHIQNLLREQLGTNNPNVRPNLLNDDTPRLDKATRRALLFLQVLRSSRQRRTGKMFEALVDACLLQGEIVVGTLLFVLLVRDWQARSILQNTQSEKAEIGEAMVDTASDWSSWPSQKTLLHDSRFLGWRRDMTPKAHSLALRSFAVERELGRAGPPMILQEAWRREQPAGSSGRSFSVRDGRSSYERPFVDEVMAGRYGLDIDLHSGSDYIPNPHSDSSRHILNSIIGAITASWHPSSSLDHSTNENFARLCSASQTISLKQLMYLINDGALIPVPASLLRAIVDLPKIAHALADQEILDRPKISALHAFHQYPPSRSSDTTNIAARLPTTLRLLSGRAVEMAIARCQTCTVTPSQDDLHALLEASYTVLKSHPHAIQVLEVMEQIGQNIHDSDTAAILIRGALAMGDLGLVRAALKRVTELYEQGNDAFDPRALLLIYGAENWGPGREENGTAMKLHQELRAKLTDKRLIPAGEPALLNAVMQYLLVTGQKRVIGFNLDLLLPFARIGPEYNVPRGLSVAASAGPNFYRNLLKALVGRGDSPVPSSFVERVWRIAKRAELHSWRLEMRRVHNEYLGVESTQEPRSQAWVLGPEVYTTVMDNYLVDQTRRGQNLEWRDAFPLNAKELAPRRKWEGYRQLYSVPLAALSRERSFELHDSLMEVSTPDRVDETLVKLWDRYEQQDGAVNWRNMQSIHSRRWRTYRRPQRSIIRQPIKRYLDSALRLWGREGEGDCAFDAGVRRHRNNSHTRSPLPQTTSKPFIRDASHELKPQWV